ncbi:myosin II light chain [Sorochytrium milnesiophthora]
MPVATANVSEDQLSDYKEAFSLFDKKGNGTIEPDSLGDLLRALGQNPTQAQVKELIDALPEAQRQIKFEAFLDMVTRPDGFQAPGTISDYVQGFQVCDKDGSGYISAAELRYVLTSLGEKLTDQDVDELLKAVDVGKDGLIHYEEFVKAIISA